MSARETELVIALVAAVGTDLEMLTTELSTELNEYRFTAHLIRLSDFLAELRDMDFTGLPFDERLHQAMDSGNALRRDWGRGDALALAAVSDMVATRTKLSDGKVGEGDEAQPLNLERHAFIIRSLKTPDELHTLRAVYGPRLFVIAAHSPEPERVAHLANQIRDSRKDNDRRHWTHQPENLIRRDMDEEKSEGQDVSDTFHRADFFIRGNDRTVAHEDIERTLRIIFGDPFTTPTKDEHAQFLAAGEARRSAELGRQVGAAIVDSRGAVVALGVNEVPIAGGGSFWEGDQGHEDNREYATREIETNQHEQQKLADAISEKLRAGFADSVREIGLGEEQQDRVVEALTDKLPDQLLSAGLKGITEFGRAVHAEMDALLDAARRGVAMQGCTAHTTTFPCHNCARHLIAAGITRVVFVEPYEKSKATTLHDDSIVLAERDGKDDRVVFVPFVGVAPRRYLDAFDAVARERFAGQSRKDADGSVRRFEKGSAVPLFIDLVVPEELRPVLPAYRQNELIALQHFKDLRARDVDSRQGL